MNGFIANQAAAQIGTAFEKTKADMTPTKSKIDWNDFNWPPLIKIAHFSLQELREPHFAIVKKLYWLYLAEAIRNVLNLINQIIQTASGYSAMRILAWFVVTLIMTGITMYGFHSGYRGICDDKSLLFRYRICAWITTALYLVFCIPNTLNFDGFIRMAAMFSDGYAFAGVMCLLETLYMLLLIGGNVFMILQVNKWDKGPVDY